MGLAEEWIVVDEAVLSGKPIIRGTRISVAFVLQLAASGMSVEDILSGFPHLSREGVLAALEYAARRMDGEEIHLLGAA